MSKKLSQSLTFQENIVAFMLHCTGKESQNYISNTCLIQSSIRPLSPSEVKLFSNCGHLATANSLEIISSVGQFLSF